MATKLQINTSDEKPATATTPAAAATVTRALSSPRKLTALEIAVRAPEAAAEEQSPSKRRPELRPQTKTPKNTTAKEQKEGEKPAAAAKPEEQSANRGARKGWDRQKDDRRRDDKRTHENRDNRRDERTHDNSRREDKRERQNDRGPENRTHDNSSHKTDRKDEVRREENNRNERKDDNRREDNRREDSRREDSRREDRREDRRDNRDRRDDRRGGRKDERKEDKRDDRNERSDKRDDKREDRGGRWDNRQKNSSVSNEDRSLAATDKPLAPVHPLQSTWTFWLSLPQYGSFAGRSERQIRWESNLKELGNFSSVEHFWSYFNHLELPSRTEANSRYFLFKSGIKPMWEHEDNVGGGKWMVQLKAPNVVDDVWQNIVLALIGEQFDSPCDEAITGAMMARRRAGDRVAVWLRQSTPEVIAELGNKIKAVAVDGLENVEIDCAFSLHETETPAAPEAT